MLADGPFHEFFDASRFYIRILVECSFEGAAPLIVFVVYVLLIQVFWGKKKVFIV